MHSKDILYLQWLSFGDYWEAAAKVKADNIPLVIMVQSTEEAVKAAAEGADAIVAQVRLKSLLKSPFTAKISTDNFVQSWKAFLSA